MLLGLVEFGVVERRDLPPESLFRLVSEHVGAQALLTLRAVVDRGGRLSRAADRHALTRGMLGRTVTDETEKILRGAPQGARAGRQDHRPESNRAAHEPGYIGQGLTGRSSGSRFSNEQHRGARP